MKTWHARLRYCGLTLAAGGLFLFNGCSLSDQQLTSVWQQVISTGLSTVVSNALTSAFGAAG